MILPAVAPQHQADVRMNSGGDHAAIGRMGDQATCGQTAVSDAHDASRKVFSCHSREGDFIIASFRFACHLLLLAASVTITAEPSSVSSPYLVPPPTTTARNPWASTSVTKLFNGLRYALMTSLASPAMPHTYSSSTGSSQRQQ